METRCKWPFEPIICPKHSLAVIVKCSDFSGACGNIGKERNLHISFAYVTVRAIYGDLRRT